MTKPLRSGITLSRGLTARKTANELLTAIIDHVQPALDVSVWLTEVETNAPGESNWNAGMEPMPAPALLDQFLEVVSALHVTDPIIDWGAPVELAESPRRVYRRTASPPG